MAQIFASERKSVPAPARRTKPADAHPIRQNAQTPAPGHDLSCLQTRADGSAVVAQLARWGQAAAQRQEQDEGAGTSGAQGRVRPTHEVLGVASNDDAALEQEADQMGARAVAQARSLSALPDPQEPDSS